jgi:low affinity Fe/Cu permease
MSRPPKSIHLTERMAAAATRWAGSNAGFATAIAIVLIWAALGPVFRYSDTWQLVVNTGTTIVTFLLVFLVQRSQNKDALAIHLKLNELVAATTGASNRLIDVEALSEHELQRLHEYFGELARLARADRDVGHAHSVEEAREHHSRKRASHMDSAARTKSAGEVSRARRAKARST